MAQHTILMVDDAPQVSKSIYRALKKQKHKILSAENGEETLRLTSEMQFEVNISEVKMSKIDEIELLD